MDVLLNTLGAKEYPSDFNKAFIIKDKDRFSHEEHIEIEKCMGENCIPCNKIIFNGKIKLIYITEKYRILTSIFERMNKKSFIKCLLQIIQCECKAKSNEKLDERKLLIDKRYIFWDMESEQVKMIYLPVTGNDISEEDALFNLKVFLKWLIQSVPMLDSRTEEDLITIITDVSLAVEQMYENLLITFNKSMKLGIEPVKKEEPLKNNERRQLVLQMVNSRQQVIFRVQERDFVIGRSAKYADGVVPDNTMVGRKHCRIKFLQNNYYLEDLDSKNGTFINGNRVLGTMSEAIAPNDVIRLANAEFVAKYLG